MAVLKANVHRRGRRRLTRDQQARQPAASVTVTSTGTTNVTLTFGSPVVVAGNMENTVTGLTLVSQTQPSPTVVTQVWSGNVSAKTYSVPAADPAVTTFTGGTNASATGTFP
jgi:hypothetical protein